MAQPISSVASSSTAPYQIRFFYDSGGVGLRMIDLFLGDNPCTPYTPDQLSEHRAGFIFHHCIVCGTKRNHHSQICFFNLKASIICTNPECGEVITNMRSKQSKLGLDGRGLFDAIWNRHIENLNSYRVYKLISPITSSNTPPYQVRFEYYHISKDDWRFSDYRTIDLFLGNNPRIHLCHDPWMGNHEFVFQRCIVCGEEKTKEYITKCERPKCHEVTWNMQFEWGKHARRLFDAIVFKHIDALNEYKVDKGLNISW